MGGCWQEMMRAEKVRQEQQRQLDEINNRLETQKLWNQVCRDSMIGLGNSPQTGPEPQTPILSKDAVTLYALQHFAPGVTVGAFLFVVQPFGEAIGADLEFAAG